MTRLLGRRGVAAAFVVAVAVAVGGIAYASIPDANGVIHGCYRPTTGQLIVATSGKGCEEGWTALNWSQTGQTGPTGPTGATGATGPGATTFATTVPQGGSQQLGDLGNGVKLTGTCIQGGGVALAIATVVPSANLQMSGTRNNDSSVSPVDDDGIGGTVSGGSTSVSLHVIARDTTVGPFVHLDVHGGSVPGNPCNFWGMIIPST